MFLNEREGFFDTAVRAARLAGELIIRNLGRVSKKDNGAFLNEDRIKVSGTRTLKESLITTGFPFRNKDITDEYLKLFRRLFLRASDLRRTGSAAIDLAYLACGRCDAFFEFGLSPWDIAAGSLIIQEAGGIVTGFSGGPDYLSTGNIAAGNPFLHGELLKEVRSVFAGPALP